MLPELDLGGGFGIAYTSEHDPLEPKALADQLADIVGRECRGLGIAVPRVSIEPGRAIAGPSTFTLYTRRRGQGRAARPRRAAAATSPSTAG